MINKPYGLDSALKSGSDIYHIETYAESRHSRVVSQIFKSGKLLDMTETTYDPKIREKSLITLVHSKHNIHIDEVSQLLNLAQEVHQRMHAESFNKMGELFLKRGFFEEAKKSFDEAINLDHTLTGAHRNLGQLFRKIGNIDKAIAQFTRALYLAPNNPDYYLDLGLAYLEKGMYDDALKELEKAINLNKDYAEAYFNLGLLILKEKVVSQEKPDEKNIMAAIMNLKYALMLDSRFQNPIFKDAFQLLENESYKPALDKLQDLKKSLRQIDVHEFVSDFEIFSQYGDLKGTPMTIDEYIDRLHARSEEFPHFPDLRNALGKAYLIKMRALFNAAIQQFKKALELNPEYGQARKNLELAEHEAKGFMLFLRAILK
jgi:tetratricopeptide (TPR) repeat protein